MQKIKCMNQIPDNVPKTEKKIQNKMCVCANLEIGDDNEQAKSNETSFVTIYQNSLYLAGFF